MMCLNRGGNTRELTYTEKREIERLVREKAAEHLRTMDVSPIEIVDASTALNAKAQAHAREVLENMANTFAVEAQYLS
jgi:hypothetical protein